jgi:3-hydroxyisobutyrate dehydrogenase-like beta-hydroxyacid dehydrogenase
MARTSPQTSKIVHERHKKFGGSYCVATVIGRPDLVETKRQFYIMAGESVQVDRVRPILESIGRGTYFFGEQPELANVAKLSFNFLIVSAIEAMAESFAFARKNGVDPSLFLTMISETLFGCPVYTSNGKALVDRQSYPQPPVTLAMLAKDTNLLVSSARESQTPMRFASVLQDRFTASLAKGRANHEWLAGIAIDVEEEAGMNSGGYRSAP